MTNQESSSIATAFCDHPEIDRAPSSVIAEDEVFANNTTPSSHDDQSAVLPEGVMLNVGANVNVVDHVDEVVPTLRRSSRKCSRRSDVPFQNSSVTAKSSTGRQKSRSIILECHADELAYSQQIELEKVESAEFRKLASDIRNPVTSMCHLISISLK